MNSEKYMECFKKAVIRVKRKEEIIRENEMKSYLKDKKTCRERSKRR